LCSYEIAIELLGILNPSRTQNLEGVGLVRIIFAQETNVTLLFVLVPKIALEGVLMLVDFVPCRHALPGLILMELLLNSIRCLSVFRLLLKVKFKGVILVLELLEETSSVRQFDVGAFFDLTVQVRLDLATVPFRDITGKQMSGQVPQ